MPYDLELPWALRCQGWRVKIRDKERLEPPHATVTRRSRVWRFDLRTGRFLDHVPRSETVHWAIRRELAQRLAELRRAWDEMYPHNRVGGGA